MNKFILIEIILVAFVVVSSLFGFISVLRVGQVVLALGIIDLLISLAAFFGWPVLRGDVTNLAPLNRQESFEIVRDDYTVNHNRPSTVFAIRIAVTGIIAIGIGLVLILILS